jgi:iron complex outermembrane receptor protein
MLLSSAGAYSANPEIDLADLSLEELMNIKVTGASKYEQKVTEAPSSISIITADDIRKFGYRTLADILRSVRSFNISYARDYSYAGVRGFGRPGDYNSRILVIIDGHRTNENIYDMSFLGTEFILDVDLIDRVEVIRGPGSSLYGNNAFFAVINVITKRGRDLKGPDVSAEAGSFQTYKGRASYGNQFQNGMEVIVSGTAYDSKGDRLYFKEFDPAYSEDPRATNNGIADHCDYDRFWSTFARLSYMGLTVEGAYSSRTKGVPTGSYLTDFNNPQKYVDTRAFVDVKYERSLGKETDIAARLFYDYDKYTGDYPGDVLYGTLNRSIANGEWWGSEVRLTSRLFDVHRLIIGAEYTDNFRKDHINYDVNPYYVYDDNKRHSTIWALYLQDEFKIFENLILNAGVRHDHYSTFGGTTNPRLGLIYSPFEKSAIKLIYGTAFRAPNDFEMLYTNVGQEANPDLKPEKIKTYELVYEQYVGDHFRMTASGYYYKISGLIESVETTPGSDITIYRNVDDVDAKGFELEMETKWANGLTGRFSYTLQWTENKQTGGRLTNSPEHLSKFNLTVPLMKEKIFGGVEELYTSRRKTLAGDYAGGFFITNLTLFSQNIVKRLELSASVYNLFDKKYSDPGLEGPDPDYSVLDTIQQDGRSFRVKVTYAF